MIFSETLQAVVRIRAHHTWQKKKGDLTFLRIDLTENLEDFRKARNFNISFPIHMSPYLSQIKRAAQQS